VLTQRVVRLLLEGVPPSRILCLTYTKAAAANMAARIHAILANWALLDDATLDAAVAKAAGPRLDAMTRDFARKLFARAVETPGGLKIQTIHAFCERLLHLFPFEANVPSRFQVMDEAHQEELLARARRTVLAEANSHKGSLGAAVQRITDECGPDGFEDLLKEAMRHAAIFGARGLGDPAEVLRRTLGLTKGRDVVLIEREMVEDGIAPGRWNDVATILDDGTKTDQDRAKQFRQVLAAYRASASDGSLGDCLASYLAIFFTAEGEPRKSLVNKALAKTHPEIEVELRAEQLRLDALLAERKAAATLDRTAALIEVASAICERYRAEKAVQGILDFDDLIDRTLALLERTTARWVLYKLDSGIDHVLVDEAQDTSEAQWKILEELT